MRFFQAFAVFFVTLMALQTISAEAKDFKATGTNVKHPSIGVAGGDVNGDGVADRAVRTKNSGKALPKTGSGGKPSTVTPSSSTPVGIDHDPSGMKRGGAGNGNKK